MDEIQEWMSPASESPFRDLIGYKPRVWRENYVEMVLALEERHRNRSGIAHGGVIATLIDVAGGFAGCFCPHPGRVRRASTLSLTTQFIGPARIGRTLIATGRTKPGGKSIYFATVEIVDDEGKSVATGEAVYKYRPGSETLEGVAR